MYSQVLPDVPRPAFEPALKASRHVDEAQDSNYTDILWSIYPPVQSSALYYAWFTPAAG